ncbi:MAG: hypothetical protein EGR12_10230 [Coprococcus catus]|nr:hypothetical protein [Coprococcus catus]
MAYNYQRNCPPCGGRPPYRNPWGPPPPGAGRPPHQGPWRPPPGPGRPPYRGSWGTAGQNHRLQSQSCAQEEEQEADDLYMTDMPEPGQMEEDWMYMQQLYPNTARKLVPYIEDAADRLEYENSMMFDNYPDRIAVEQVVKEIIAVIQENEPALITMPEDTAASDRNEDQTWDSCMEEMIQIMLLGEMHHRRWRYQQMNRRNY